MSKPIKVAVFMPTYNQEAYVARAIRSVLAQTGKFELKLFIGEDASTDNTASICQDFEQRFGNYIDLQCNAQNLGPIANAYQVYERCFAFGDYTAMLEGDDYWTDPAKLARQLEALEAEPRADLCVADGSSGHRHGESAVHHQHG